MRLTIDYALEKIPRPDGRSHVKKRSYDTDDIIQLMVDYDGADTDEVAEFARHIPPTREGLQAVHDFLLENIRYRRDPKNSQWLLSPGRLVHERGQGSDCKSWTHFTTNILRSMGLDYDIDFTSYKKRRRTPYHVYPVAYLPTGERVPMDAVWARSGGTFGREKPWAHKTTYKVRQQGLAYLSGVEEEKANILDAIVEIDRVIPDTVLFNDVTQMTEGQLLRKQMSDRMKIAARHAGEDGRIRYLHAAAAIETRTIAGIGAMGEMSGAIKDFIQKTEKLSRPAFKMPRLRISATELESIDGLKLGNFIKKVGKGIGKGAKAVGKGAGNAAKAVALAFKKALQKLMNWLFKGALRKSAPFFLFTFIKGPKGEVAKRARKQNKVLGFIQKLTGAKTSNIQAELKNGIIDKMGDAPRRILNNRAGAQIAAVPAVTAAIPIVLEAVRKVANLFKKTAPEVRDEDASDLDLVDVKGSAASDNEKESGSSSEKKGVPGWAIPAAGIALSLLLRSG